METESVYNCSTGDSQSVLQVKNSSKLLIGDHSVQCILNQNIPKDFQEDDSFDENLNSLTTRIAAFTITEGTPSSLGECRSCDSHVITYTCTCSSPLLTNGQNHKFLLRDFKVELTP